MVIVLFTHPIVPMPTHNNPFFILIASLILGTLFCSASHAQDRSIFWLQDSNIFRLDLDTGEPDANPIALFPSIDETQAEVALAVDPINQQLYWNGGQEAIEPGQPFPPNVFRSDFNGEQIEPLGFFNCGLGGISDIALNVPGNQLYVLINSDCSGDLQRANLDGSDPEPGLISAIPFRPGRMEVDWIGNRIFWTDSFFEPAIKVTDPSTGASTVFANLAAQDIALDLNSWMLYLTTVSDDDGTIQRIPLEGGDPELILDGLNNPIDIALDVNGGWMYWIDQGSGTISQARLDGTERKVLITGVEEASNLVLSFENTGVPITHVEPNSVPEDVQWTMYPNPTQADVTVSFTVQETTPVAIDVYDLLGRAVATLASSTYAPGNHRLNWETGNVAHGIYLVQLNIEGRQETRKVIVY